MQNRFIWRRIRLAMTVVAVSAVLAACGDKSDAELLASANSYLDKKDTKSAIIQIKNVLQNNGSSAEARFLLGKALLASGDASGAEIELKRALELKYPQAAVQPVMARALLARSEFKVVAERYAAMVLDDKDAQVDLQTSVALAYAAQGLHDKAREAIMRALELAPRANAALLVHARIKADAGDLTGALAVLDEMLQRDPKDFEAWQLKGDMLLQGKTDAQGAIAAYQQALAIKPDSAALHANLISLYFAQNDLQAASRQFALLKATQPEHPFTGFYSAQIAFSQGDFQGTRTSLQSQLRAAPENAALLHLAGATELQLGANAQAESYLARAVQLQPQFVSARRLLAQVYLRQDRPLKAIAVLQPLTDGKVKDAEALALAGRAYLLADDLKMADAMFKRASDLKPADARTRTSLALAQLSTGKAEAAFSELQTIAAQDNSTDADLAIVSARMQRGEHDAALKAIAALEKKQPNSAIVADLRGRVYLLRKDIANAKKNFEAAIALNPTYLSSVTKLAAIDFLEKRPEAAEGRFKNLLKVDPKNTQALLALADIKRRTGAPREEVIKMIGEAVSANPTDPDPRLQLIDFYLTGGDLGSALTAAQAGVQAVPLSVEIQDRLARALLATGDKNQASATFAKMTSTHPDSPLGYQGLADMGIAVGDFESAAKNSRRVLDLAPNSMAAMRTAIIAAMNQNRIEDALAMARTVQKEHPNDALGPILEGEIEATQSRWPRAAASFRKALSKANPAQAPARLHFVLLADDKPGDADKFAEGWLNEHPKDMLFRLYFASAAQKTGDAANAEKYYQQVINAQPNNVLALNNLAILWIAQKNKGAVGLAERAVKASPGNPTPMATLAEALASEGQFDKAIEVQRQAITMAPDATALRLSLAKIYLRSGDKAKAKAELESIKQTKAKAEWMDEADKLLKTL